MELSKEKYLYSFPFLICLSLLAVFSLEFFLMLLLSRLSLPPAKEAFLDSLLLTILTAPLFYFFWHRPRQETILDLKEARESLKDSNKKIKALVQTVGEGIISISQDSGIRFVNKELCRLFGYGEEELMDKPVQILMPGKYREAHAIGMKRHLESGESSALGRWLELEGMRKDGTVFPLEINIREVILEGSNERIFTAAIRDLTGKKQAEKKIRDQNAFLTNIMESLSHPFYVIDAKDHAVLMANSASGFGDLSQRPQCRPLPHGRGEFCGESKVLCPLEEIKRTGKPVVVEHAHYGKEGRAKFMDVHAHPVFDGDGKLVRVIEYCLDVTERKQAEKDKEALFAKLQKANEDLKEFLYAASHDLKTPLRAMHNYADFLMEDSKGKLDEEQQSYLDGLRESVVQAEDLVNGLLMMSRVGSQTLEIKPVNAGAAIREIIGSLSLHRDIEIVMKEDWPQVETDPPLFRQIFSRLIDNAVKFNSSSPKRVEVDWRSVSENYNEFVVRDNGIGIDPRFFSHILRPFQRLHTRKEYKGAGIGLAITAKAVERLRGSLRIESAPGEGSAFFVALPKRFDP